MLGKDIPTAADNLATAFSGSYTELAKFDDKLNFLTTTQREYIRSLYE